MLIKAWHYNGNSIHNYLDNYFYDSIITNNPQEMQEIIIFL